MSLSRSQLKTLAECKQRKVRAERGSFIAEGRKLVGEALNYGIVRQLICSDSSDYEELRRQAESIGAEVLIAAEEQFTRFCDSRSPQPVAAVCAMPENRRANMEWGKGPVLLLEELQIPDNVGGIIRSAAAFAASAVVLTAGSCDPFNAKAVRASQGGIFRVPLAWDCDSESAIPNWLADGAKVFVTTPRREAEDFASVEYSDRTIIVIGNEARGASPAMCERADGMIHVPLHAAAESLNASVAAGIVLQDFYRRQGS